MLWPWPHKRRTPIEFEFGRATRPQTRLPWAFLILTFMFAGNTVWSYVAVLERMRGLTTRIAALPPASSGMIEAGHEPKDLSREMAAAKTVIRRIALPWNDLFKALNASAIEEVALISIEPDADDGSLQLTAQAKDLPAMLTYLARIETHPRFRDAVISRHEMRQTKGQHPIHFVVNATWSH